MFSNPNCRQPLDEAFIWWVLLELSKAVVTLQTGLNADQILRLQATHHPPRSAARGPPRTYRQDVERLLGVEQWPVIVHRNITLDNIYLHFPEEGERSGRLPTALPDVVLCTFSEANTTADSRERWNLSRGQLAQIANQDNGENDPFVGRKSRAAEDRHALGVVVRRLVSFLDGVRDTGTLDYDIDEYPMWEYYGLPEGRTPGRSVYYSDGLVEMLMWFEWPRAANADDGRRRELDKLFQRYPAGWTQIV